MTIYKELSFFLQYDKNLSGHGQEYEENQIVVFLICFEGNKSR